MKTPRIFRDDGGLLHEGVHDDTGTLSTTVPSFLSLPVAAQIYYSTPQKKSQPW